DTGREVLRLTDRAPGFAFCRFTADGRLALADSDRLRFFDLPSGKEVAPRPVGGVARLTPDGAVFVRIGQEQKEALVGDATTGRGRPGRVCRAGGIRSAARSASCTSRATGGRW